MTESRFLNNYFGYSYQTSVILNQDLQRSVNYVESFPEDSQLREIIANYRNELHSAFDPNHSEFEEGQHSWRQMKDSPHILEYTLINWILYESHENLFNTLHDAIRNDFITYDQLCRMIHNVFTLCDELKKFPPIQNPDGITVYRGVGRNSRKLLNIPIGGYYTSKAVMATSLRPASALRFSAGIILEIHLPPGTPFSFLGSTIDIRPDGELEVLLPFGVVFQINDVKRIRDDETHRTITVIEATLVDYRPIANDANSFCLSLKRFFPRDENEPRRSIRQALSQYRQTNNFARGRRRARRSRKKAVSRRNKNRKTRNHK